MSRKAVILLSGGIDSSTCLALAKQAGFACYALSFDYGQRSIVELHAAKKIAQHMGIESHRVIDMRDIGRFGGSAITDHDTPLKEDQHGDDIPSSYVPARNTMFLSIALSWAEAIEAESIFIGVHKDDHTNYPDCRPIFIETYQALANVANRMGVEGNPIQIAAPLLHRSKAAIIQQGSALNVPYELTVTCYQVDMQARLWQMLKLRNT